MTEIKIGRSAANRITVSFPYNPSIAKIKPIFSGAEDGRHISTRIVQAIFEQAKEKASIRKDVTIHSLMHSFATHLLEGGTDLRYIQELLGYKNSKTTGIYVHVSNTALGKITSPLDTMDFKKIKVKRMEKAERHIQNEYMRNADMIELADILLSGKRRW